jgi:hypothetical protein
MDVPKCITSTATLLIFPTGLGVFKAGGGLSFHHGGFSLQELAIPVISLRMTAGKPAEAPRGAGPA